MQQPRSILAGVDFSQCSFIAMKQAALLARWADAELHIVHVIRPNVVENLASAMGVPTGPLTEQVIGESTEDLQQFAAKAGLAETARLHVVTGKPFEQMQQLVDDISAELVVLGMLGAGERGDGAGTTATQAARQLSVNVLLVHESHDGPYKRIVAAVDFTDASRAVLQAAGMVAQCDHSALHVLHAYDAPWHHLHYRSDSEQSTPQFREQYVHRLQSRLEHIAAPVREDLPDDRCTCALTDCRSYGFGIVDYATHNKADLVVVGAGSHSKLHRIFVGSTAERVLRETQCSVLVVKSAS